MSECLYLQQVCALWVEGDILCFTSVPLTFALQCSVSNIPAVLLGPNKIPHLVYLQRERHLDIIGQLITTTETGELIELSICCVELLN